MHICPVSRSALAVELIRWDLSALKGLSFFQSTGGMRVMVIRTFKCQERLPLINVAGL